MQETVKFHFQFHLHISLKKNFIEMLGESDFLSFTLRRKQWTEIVSAMNKQPRGHLQEINWFEFDCR